MGAIASQLGRAEVFRDLYTPLQAPGQTAWETLLADQPPPILLDELPPYFENARAKQIGNSDLSQVTATALSNLLVAIGRPTRARVCLVITDLTASYAQGSQQIGSVLADFERETHRSAMSLEPVRINLGELYHILRQQFFEQLPAEAEISEVAQAYAKAVSDAKQMSSLTGRPSSSPPASRPPTPSLPPSATCTPASARSPASSRPCDLICYMRIATTRLWESGEAKQCYLIAAHGLNFNDRETRAEISQINNILDNAIASAGAPLLGFTPFSGCPR